MFGNILIICTLHAWFILCVEGLRLEQLFYGATSPRFELHGSITAGTVGWPLQVIQTWLYDAVWVPAVLDKHHEPHWWHQRAVGVDSDSLPDVNSSSSFSREEIRDRTWPRLGTESKYLRDPSSAPLHSCLPAFPGRPKWLKIPSLCWHQC